MKKMNDKTKLLILGLVIISLMVGFWIGMIVQQMIFTTSVIGIAEAFEGNTLNIEININETLMVDRMFSHINNSLNQSES